MRLVCVESPLAGASEAIVESNKRYARRLMRHLLMRGDAPFASHLLYTQMLDDNVPAVGIEAGLCWGAQAELTVVGVDLGISSGMRRGIARARAERRPVEFLSLPEYRLADADPFERVRYACVDNFGDKFTLAQAA